MNRPGEHPVLPFPSFQPQHCGFRPSGVASAPQKQKLSLWYDSPVASKCQACRAQALPWKQGSAWSWLMPFPQRWQVPWVLLPAGRPLTHFQGNSQGVFCSTCFQGCCLLPKQSSGATWETDRGAVLVTTRAPSESPRSLRDCPGMAASASWPLRSHCPKEETMW